MVQQESDHNHHIIMPNAKSRNLGLNVLVLLIDHGSKFKYIPSSVFYLKNVECQTLEIAVMFLAINRRTVSTLFSS